MCGFAAIISSDPSQRAKMSTMLDVQHMRGPDHRAIWEGDCVILGHNRLALLDLGETGDQPMEGERYVLTYNGEIYNHLELRSQCVGYRWRGTSDTETLLAMIETFGVERTLPKLNGMWAFAVWDKVSRCLTMATDPFGMKPLFWYHSGETFACASSSAAILNLQATWRVSMQGIAQYFHLGGSLGAWDGIEKMDGGHMIVIDGPLQTHGRWYEPTFQEHAAEGLEDLIIDAIRKTSVADVPVGIFFSGGIDTTIIASVHQGSRAFHLDGPERQYAEQGAAHFGLDLRIVDPNARRTTEALTDIAKQSGEPSMAGYIPWLVSEEAAQSVKACISGNGADELFFGYDRTNSPSQHSHTFRDRSIYGGADPQWPFYPLEDERFTDCAQSRWLELMHYVQHDLNPTLDAASMCHSLEVRVPFLDVRLVEAALSLPASFHGRKRVLKEMLAGMGLPSSYTDRPKHGFSMSASDPRIEQYKERAWGEACAKYGMNPGNIRRRKGARYRSTHGQLSGRDVSYLHAAAGGWKAWYETWKHKMA
jgi:asparagine synthetase B (glutamine-hydrolysing)